MSWMLVYAMEWHMRKLRFFTLLHLLIQTHTKRQKEYPEDFADRDGDKFNYRYRGSLRIAIFKQVLMDIVQGVNPTAMSLFAWNRSLWS